MRVGSVLKTRAKAVLSFEVKLDRKIGSDTRGDVLEVGVGAVLKLDLDTVAKAVLESELDKGLMVKAQITG